MPILSSTVAATTMAKVILIIGHQRGPEYDAAAVRRFAAEKMAIAKEAKFYDGCLSLRLKALMKRV